MSKKKLIISLILVTTLFVFTKQSLAVCPLCVVAVAGGIELSRILKINDIITGLWIGGLIISLIYWTIEWIDKKGIKFFGKNLLIILLWYILIFWSLNLVGIYSRPIGNIPYFSQINFGILIGSVVFWFAVEFNNFLKEKNNGKSFFPFQKVVIPVGLLLILSVIFYFLI